MSKID